MSPSRALVGADARAIGVFDVLVKLGTAVQASQGLATLQEEVLQICRTSRELGGTPLALWAAVIFAARAIAFF